MWKGQAAVIVFEAKGRQIRFVLQLPDRHDKQFHHTATGRFRKNPDAALDAWEQACRSMWRALALCVKAKLEAVESGIETFEEAFLSHIVLPDHSTVGEFVLPQVTAAYQTGKMPPLLPSARLAREKP